VKSLHRRLAVLLGSLLCACERSAPNGSYTLPWDVRQHVTIGVEAGDPTAEFGRIAGVVKLPDGSIAVALATAIVGACLGLVCGLIIVVYGLRVW
jgi:hypothetical protein